MLPWRELDRRGALALHRASATPAVLRLLAACSRLSDADAWCLVVAVLWFTHPPLARTMTLLGAANLALYALLKQGTRRDRPCDPLKGCAGIRACTPVPDAFSFPSGHTLHAVAFSLPLAAAFPTLAPALWTFATLVAVSRVVLGLHYPSDVVAGAAIGGITGLVLA